MESIYITFAGQRLKAVLELSESEGFGIVGLYQGGQDITWLLQTELEYDIYQSVYHEQEIAP